jgi:DNA-binding response OmpR family regulator
MNSKVILCVEDNMAVQTFNKPLLEQAGYTVKPAMTLAGAWETVRREMPGLIVLDIHMTDGNGLDFLRELRKTSNVPVLLLTGDSKDADMVSGFQSGCDDYLPKPYAFPVLLARIEALLRRAASVPEILTKGNLTLGITKMIARVNGEDLSLPPKEFALLLFFVQHEGSTMSDEYLYETIWGQPMIDDNSAIKNMIYKLRKKLNGSGYTITNERGEGYCFGAI